jgi:hypothetical protein
MPAVKEMYKKSILFEIVEKGHFSTPIEAFTLTIPPESLEIEENQRISETETFGGIFLDDYGEGLKNIRISGHTGGSTVRKTYVGPSFKLERVNEFDGRSAFFHFRDRLMRYKSYKSKDRTYENYDMYVYDLSTIPPNWDFERNPPENFVEAYVCFLKKFKMNRSKERPFFYNYSIELVAVRIIGNYVELPREIIPTENNTRKWLAAIRRGLRLTKGYFTTVRNAMDQVDNILDVVDDLESQLNAFIDQTGDLVYYPFALASRTMVMMVELEDLVENAETEITVTQGKIKSTYYGVLSALRESSAASAALVTYAKTPGAYGNEIRRISREDARLQSAITRFGGLSEDESEITSKVLGQDISGETTYYIYGYILVTAVQDTTLERLSIDYYGSVGFVELIAVFNKIKGDDEIATGDIIKIPVITKGKTPENNLVYTELRNDVYGSDIKLDNSGKIVAMASGDLARIEGIENLVQAINLRLNDQLGSRLRLALYGIRDSIGFAMGETTPVAYVMANIKDTLMQDPRVDGVENIRLKVDKDKIYTSMSIHSVKIGEVIPFKGGIG